MTTLSDDTTLASVANPSLLTGRIRDLATQRYVSSWMLVEVVATSHLLDSQSVTAGQVWQLVLAQHGLGPAVSSSPDRHNSNRLAAPLADRDLVWAHLTELSAGRPAAPVEPLPGPYDDTTDVGIEVVEQALAYLTRQLNLLERSCHVSGTDVFDQFEYELRFSIENHLATQWLGSPLAIGASLYNLPIQGRGGFGLEGQLVDLLEALIRALQHELDKPRSAESLGFAALWATFLKGFIFAMVHTGSGVNVPAYMLRRPHLMPTLERVVDQVLTALNDPEPTPTPQWTSLGGSALATEIHEVPLVRLMDMLVERLAAEQHDRTQMEGM